MKLVRLFALFASCLTVALLNRTEAVNLLYNFEGDSGTTVTDKLTNDGAQNGTIYNNVSAFPVTGGTAPGFGSSVGFFDNPPAMVTKDYSTIEVPDSTFDAGFSLTLSGWVYQDIIDTDLRRFRIFSSFAGTGGTVPADRILFDAGNNSTRSDIRAVVGGISFLAPAPSPTLPPGYHHYAMTVDNTLTGNDKVKLYIDGQLMTPGSVTGTLGTSYSNNFNLRIAEDINQFPLANSANEQIVGNVDDMLVLGRALSASQISAIYNAGVGAPISSIVTPQPSERAIYYDFEGDSGSTVTDKFTLDGSQNGIPNNTDPQYAVVDNNPANAKLGSSSFKFGNPIPATTPGHEIFSQINAGPVGNLGPNFTLSAVINPYSTGVTGNGVARVFSSYLGGSATNGQLIVDFNPNTTTGIRVFLPSNTGSPTLHYNVAGAIDLDYGTMQTLTVVYETGTLNDVLSLYLDGALLKTELLPAGTAQTLNLDDLRIGEDRGGYFGARANENFIGTMDDIMVLNRALTAEQVGYLHTNGADALIATLPTGTPGDFDGDGDVDGRDFLVWQRNPSIGSLAEWQANYGNGALVANVAIPEPSTMAVALVGLAILIRGRTMARKCRLVATSH
jgi:hypothetical protein